MDSLNKLKGNHIFTGNIRLIQLFIFSFIITGLFFSRAIPAIGIGAYVVLGLFELIRNNRGKSVLLSRESIPYLLFTLPVVASLFGGLYSEDFAHFVKDIRVRLPILLMPLAAIYLPKLKMKEYFGLLALTTIIACISSVYPLYHLFNSWEENIDKIGKGQSIPTLVNHVRYSIMTAFGAVAGYYLYIKRFRFSYSWEPYIYLLMSASLFVFLHLLSVRSGLMVLYFGFFLITIQQVISIKSKWKWLMLPVLILFPYLLYLGLPTLQEKVNYTIWDLQQWSQGKGEQYSDSGRLISFQAAIESLEGSKIITGHGTGDESLAIEKIYKDKFPSLQKKLNVHNQYLTFIMETGVLGLTAFLVSIYFLIFPHIRKKDTFYLFTVLSLCLTFMIENTLGSSVGVSLYCLYVLMGLQYVRNTSSAKVSS